MTVYMGDFTDVLSEHWSAEVNEKSHQFWALRTLLEQQTGENLEDGSMARPLHLNGTKYVVGVTALSCKGNQRGAHKPEYLCLVTNREVLIGFAEPLAEAYRRRWR